MSAKKKSRMKPQAPRKTKPRNWGGDNRRKIILNDKDIVSRDAHSLVNPSNGMPYFPNGLTEIGEALKFEDFSYEVSTCMNNSFRDFRVFAHAWVYPARIAKLDRSDKEFSGYSSVEKRKELRKRAKKLFLFDGVINIFSENPRDKSDGGKLERMGRIWLARNKDTDMKNILFGNAKYEEKFSERVEAILAGYQIQAKTYGPGPRIVRCDGGPIRR